MGAGCPVGRYAEGSSCNDCDKGFWCPGGMFDGLGAPGKSECPPSMTTRGTRSTSIRVCGKQVAVGYVMTVAAVTI
jgi:hypothetical protein